MAKFSELSLEQLATPGEEQPGSQRAYDRYLEFQKRQTDAMLNATTAQQEAATHIKNQATLSAVSIVVLAIAAVIQAYATLIS